MNTCHFIGNLTKDPQSFTTQSGNAKCTFSIAVQRKRAGADGVRKADFIPITCWRTLAENCAKYLKKGRRVAVTCHVQTETYETDNGDKRFSINFVADDVEFQPSGGGNGNAQPHDDQNGGGSAVPAGGGFVQVDDEELPFDM